MNYLDASTQQWVKSDPSFIAMPGGIGFTAQKMQHQVTLDANLNAVGAVTAVTPDGITLESTPVAIGLYDAASGKSVTVATLTNSAGVLLDPQHVVYQNALVGDLLQADVTYALPDCGSFHQNIVISHFNGPLDPTAFGFPASSTNTMQIQFFTEFYENPPAPQEIVKPIYVEQDQAKRASMASPDLIDNMLAFGRTKLSRTRPEMQRYSNANQSRYLSHSRRTTKGGIGFKLATQLKERKLQYERSQCP